eukprot:CAMPEP_0176229792 /NCGR_PEP_ID=MMETSP0121_2-20121125/23968_1 /TAXON_ID=160619 /ORGANISM="Kryptoperidinium foliaceum, Strain CCMP 1326" /LENGTH=94 /DNA_ID=CAMNT_0017569119 /DNA_START=164 /DNA_END=448 /DNA_ORIENTATION=-
MTPQEQDARPAASPPLAGAGAVPRGGRRSSDRVLPHQGEGRLDNGALMGSQAAEHGKFNLGAIRGGQLHSAFSLVLLREVGAYPLAAPDMQGPR